MAPSTPLQIATASANRLLKEEASYHKELKQQEDGVEKLKNGDQDENTEYLIKQQLRAIDETEALIPELRKKIEQALANLQRELKQDSGDNSAEDVAKAEEAAQKAEGFIG